MLTLGAVRRVAFVILAAVLLAAVLAACSTERSGGEPPGGESERDVLTVVSANIYLGGEKDPGLNGIACHLSNADIAFLQEVDEDAARTLARKSGLTNFRFAKDEGLEGGEYGVAVLSRSPLRRAEVRKLTGTEPGYDVILKTTSRLRGEPVALITALYPAGYNEQGKQGRLKASEAVLSISKLAMNFHSSQ